MARDLAYQRRLSSLEGRDLRTLEDRETRMSLTKLHYSDRRMSSTRLEELTPVSQDKFSL